MGLDQNISLQYKKSLSEWILIKIIIEITDTIAFAIKLNHLVQYTFSFYETPADQISSTI